jgi:hypothetical protein
MKSRFLIFTLSLAVMCIAGAGNAMAQSVTGTGVFEMSNDGAPTTVTVSAQQGGNGGIMRYGRGQDEIIAQPIDVCVQGNRALVVAFITQRNGVFESLVFNYLVLGFQDNGNDGDLLMLPFGQLISPSPPSACDAISFPTLDFPMERGGFQVKSPTVT